MAIEAVKFRIVGEAPLLMHSGRLADPLDGFVKKMKKISGKRSKTEADHEEMARLEWYGGLYLSEEGEIVIPSFVMEACLIGRGGAAGKEKMRTQGTAGMYIQDDIPLTYEDPQDIDERWAEVACRLRAKVKVGQASVMRTRPIFHEWSAEPIVIYYSPKILNPDAIIRWMEVAGEQVGLCDWRPRYGRFTAEVLKK